MEGYKREFIQFLEGAGVLKFGDFTAKSGRKIPYFINAGEIKTGDQIAKLGEDAKVAIRNIRRDAIEDFKAQKKKSEITEDDYKVIEKDFQKITDDYIKKIDEITSKKEKELTEI